MQVLIVCQDEDDVRSLVTRKKLLLLATETPGSGIEANAGAQQTQGRAP